MGPNVIRNESSFCPDFHEGNVGHDGDDVFADPCHHCCFHWLAKWSLALLLWLVAVAWWVDGGLGLHWQEMVNEMGCIAGGVECARLTCHPAVGLVDRGVATLPSYAVVQRLGDGDRLPTQSGDNACMISACLHDHVDEMDGMKANAAMVVRLEVGM